MAAAAAAAARSKGRAIAGSLVSRVLAGKAASPRYRNPLLWALGTSPACLTVVLRRTIIEGPRGSTWNWKPATVPLHLESPNQARSFHHPCSHAFVKRRAVHASAYDKNLEDQVRPAFVPDDVIGGAGNPDKYWSPHPKTGVFGPAAVDPNLAAAAAGAPDAAANAAGGTVLDQKVWFRPLEDVEKPPPVA